MKYGLKLAIIIIFTGIFIIGCTPLSERQFGSTLSGELITAPRALLGSVTRNPCDYFFSEFFERIDAGGHWLANYARVEWSQQDGLEKVNSISAIEPFVAFGGRPGLGFASGDFNYNSSITGIRELTRIIISRAGFISDGDSVLGSEQLIDLQCRVVGKTGWLIQGVGVDAENSFDTERTYQWASSLVLVSGTLN